MIDVGVAMIGAGCPSSVKRICPSTTAKNSRVSGRIRVAILKPGAPWLYSACQFSSLTTTSIQFACALCRAFRSTSLMCGLLVPYWPGLALAAHHSRYVGGPPCPRPPRPPCCCVWTVGAPRPTVRIVATAMAPCKRFIASSFSRERKIFREFESRQYRKTPRKTKHNDLRVPREADTSSAGREPYATEHGRLQNDQLDAARGRGRRVSAAATTADATARTWRAHDATPRAVETSS